MIRRCAILSFLLCCLAGQALGQQDPAAAERELRQIRQRIESLEREVRSATADRGKSQRKLRDAELAVAAAEKKRRQLVAERERVEARLAELRASEARSRAALTQEQAALAEQLRIAYISGREEWLRLLLSQQDPIIAGRHLVYYTYITSERSGIVDQVRASLAELADTVAAAAEERARLEKLAGEQAKRLAELEAARAERAALVARLDREIEGRQGEIAGLRQQAADVEKLVAKLRAALAELELDGATDFGKRRGQLPWPADGPVLARYGQPRADGSLRWNGTLLGARSGSEVRAVHQGRVVFADWLNGLGLLVVLDHGDGYMTLYGHNQDVVCQIGDRVAPGDVLGHVGDSGGQAAAGLYFEIRRNGKPLDPKAWMKR